MLLITDVKNFMSLIFAVWLNRESFLPSKFLQTTVYTSTYILRLTVVSHKAKKSDHASTF